MKTAIMTVFLAVVVMLATFDLCLLVWACVEEFR